MVEIKWSFRNSIEVKLFQFKTVLRDEGILCAPHGAERIGYSHIKEWNWIHIFYHPQKLTQKGLKDLNVKHEIPRKHWNKESS